MSANFCGLVLELIIYYGGTFSDKSWLYFVIRGVVNLTLALIRYCAFILTSE